MSATLIINALVVNAGGIVEADVRIRDGRIAQIGAGLTCYGDEELVDAACCHLLPGLIDTCIPAPDLQPEAVAAWVAAGVTSCTGLSAAAAAGLVNHAGDTPRADGEATRVDLSAALEAIADGRDTAEALAERAAHVPARRHRLCERGFLVEGGWADLVLIDLAPSDAVHIRAVWVSGEKVVDGGRLLEARPGLALVFAD